MAGVWRKTMKYLGLVEEDEYPGAERVAPEPEPAIATRRMGGNERSPARPMERPGGEGPVGGHEPEAIVRTIPQSRSTSGTIHRAEPKRFNEARELGERFKDGIPVIMNLQGTEDHIARRLVDFASGLVFAHDGKIELVANRVYLLTPADVDVSAEERERLREGGFYNQF
ncbi:MAG TPA: cell division protein SepF [Actinomycetota bacterium]|nr:cell division protein SepF [Actinomycetota bacterium]